VGHDVVHELAQWTVEVGLAYLGGSITDLNVVDVPVWLRSGFGDVVQPHIADEVGHRRMVRRVDLGTTDHPGEPATAGDGHSHLTLTPTAAHASRTALLSALFTPNSLPAVA
jgi:hypothetical protein